MKLLYIVNSAGCGRIFSSLRRSPMVLFINIVSKCFSKIHNYGDKHINVFLD